MSRPRLVLLGAAVALSMLAAAPVASAKISFHWVVAGSILSASEHKTFDLNNDGKTFDIHLDVGALPVLLLSGSVSVLPGAQIIGGILSATEDTLLLKNVTVDTPANCTVSQGSTTGTIKTLPLKTEIVEGALGGTGNGEVELLFAPKEGEEFADFNILGATCSAEGTEAEIDGNVLGLPLPQRTEVARQDVGFEAVTKEYMNVLGEAKKAGLVRGVIPVTVNGLALMLLTSGELFGPF